MHVWHPLHSRRQQPPQVCHSHGWILTSRVLNGCLDNELFDVSEVEGGDCRAFTIRYGEGVSRAEQMAGTYAVSPTRSERIAADTLYNIPADTFHWTHIPTSDVVVTAMTRSHSDSPSAPLTFRRIPCDFSYTYEREACSPEVTQQVAADLLHYLA